MTRAIAPVAVPCAVCPAARDAIVRTTGIAPHAGHAALAGVASQPSTILAVDHAARKLGHRAPQAEALGARRAA